MTDSTHRSPLLPGALAGLLGLSVLAMGSTPYWARAMLQSGILLLFYLWWRSTEEPTPAGSAAAALARLRLATGLFIGVILLQLVPLPPALRGLLAPGRVGLETTPSVVLQASATSEASPVGALPPAVPDRAWLPLSLRPADTIDALILFLTYIALFVLVRNMVSSRARLLWFCRVLAGIGGIVGAAGLLQDLAGAERIYGLMRLRLGGAPYGPFVNHNHFAGLMELTLPVAFALLARRARPRRQLQFWVAAEVDGVSRSRMDDDRARQLRHVIEGSLLVASVAVMCVALLRSLSRGGLLSLACASVAVFVLVPSRGRIRPREVAILGMLAASAFALFVWLGPSDTLDHFRAAQDVQNEPSIRGRVLTWEGCLAVSRDYPILGSGLGTFESAFRQHYPPGTRRLWLQAHNDYLQLLTEVGAAGAAVAVFGMIVLGAVLLPPLLRGRELQERYLYYGLLTAILSLLLHSVVDFNLQIPANAALFVVVCALAVAHRIVLEGDAPRKGRPFAAPAGSGTAPARRRAGRPVPEWLLVLGLLGALGWVEMRAAGTWLQRSSHELIVEGNLEEGLRRFDRATQLAPAGTVALAGKARAFLELARREPPGSPARMRALESAVAFYRQALERQPIDPGTWGALGNAYRSLAVASRASRPLDLSSLDEAPPPEPEDVLAVAAARQAVRLEPHDYVHTLLLGDLLHWQGNPEALEWYHRTGFLWPRMITEPFPISPEPPAEVVAAIIAGAYAAVDSGNRVPDAKILEELALFHASRGEHAAAVDANLRAIDLVRAADPDAPILAYLWSRQATLLVILERYDEAEEMLRGVLQRNPSHPPAYLALGKLLADRDGPAEAVADLRRARDLAPGELPYQMELARTLERADDDTAAVQEYRRAATIRDGQVPAYRALARLYRRKGQSEEAGAYERLLREIEAGGAATGR